MKINVLGFEQGEIVKINDDMINKVKLNAGDLLVLRQMVDMIESERLETKEIDGEVYTWINYSLLVEDLPMITSSVETIKKIVAKFITLGLLDRKVKKNINGGAFTYFKITARLNAIKYVPETVEIKKATVNKSNKSDEVKKSNKQYKEEKFVADGNNANEIKVEIIGEVMTEELTITTANILLGALDKICLTALVSHLEHNKSNTGYINNKFVQKAIQVALKNWENSNKENKITNFLLK